MSGFERWVRLSEMHVTEFSSRERILKTLAHEAADRVPISTYELVGWDVEAWENKEPSYLTLMQLIRDKTDCIFMVGAPWLQMTSDSYSYCYEKSDCYEETTWQEGASSYVRRTYHTTRGELTSLQRRDTGLHTTWTLEHLLKEAEDIGRYLSIPFEPQDVDLAGFQRKREMLGDRGVMMISIADPICVGAELFEMGQFLTLAVTDTRRVCYFLDAIHERQMSSLAELSRHDLSGAIVRISGPEYATPPYLSPEHFMRFVTKYLREICSSIRGAGGYARVHCHGKIGSVLDQIVDSGAQGLDPIEPPPDGDITLGEAKRRFGKELCLFGNVELKELEHSPPERIDQLVRTAMDEAKHGGGFVLMPTAAPIDVPLSPKTERNYIQLIESGLCHGRY